MERNEHGGTTAWFTVPLASRDLFKSSEPSTPSTPWSKQLGVAKESSEKIQVATPSLYVSAYLSISKSAYQCKDVLMHM